MNVMVGDLLPERQHTPDNVQLMLYNAALWNGHRIHFDEAYARDVEGYPGLVIAGPLLGDWLHQVVELWHCRAPDQNRIFQSPGKLHRRNPDRWRYCHPSGRRPGHH